MPAPNLYQQVFKSLVKFLQDYIATQTVAPIEFINWDAHVSTNTLPEKDLVGIAGLSMMESEKVYDITVSFGVSTYQDLNLLRHVRMIGELFAMVPSEATLPWLNDAGVEIGKLVVKDEPEISPVEPTTTRPLQFISMSMTGTVTRQL